jgi:hypothetical protein
MRVLYYRDARSLNKVSHIFPWLLVRKKADLFFSVSSKLRPSPQKAQPFQNHASWTRHGHSQKKSEDTERRRSDCNGLLLLYLSSSQPPNANTTNGNCTIEPGQNLSLSLTFFQSAKFNHGRTHSSFRWHRYRKSPKPGPCTLLCTRPLPLNKIFSFFPRFFCIFCPLVLVLQKHKIVAKRGAHFTIMVVGASISKCVQNKEITRNSQVNPVWERRRSSTRSSPPSLGRRKTTAGGITSSWTS